ncbi:hypothetical protein NKR74_04350 [Bacillus sp. 3103sda1]|uniref:hypothetical protein n=1 Tax=Bacillus sp. 3103sda1 TaxID=2953808 RepID=UPI0020A20309|nr:hypothetical protein [Bacillus sp. 3103sda1]MCP1122583.1 hypothetical protein [Bacillus sp. 3103sda1]
MDVHYKPDAWQEMKEGIDQITKEALMELKSANDLLEKIEAKIHSLDSDRSIHFQHTSQQGKINRLLDDYITLGNYCTKAGEAVSKHIDEPFHKDMDKFAEKMSHLSIRNYSTKNRIGSTSTTTMPNAHGYGMPQTITTKKDKITVDDIFKDSVAFDKVLHAQYQEIKKQNPDAKLDYAEYRKLVPSMRGFEYTSIEDEQKKLETWRDLAIGAGLIILTIACPPAGLTASALYGGLQIKSAYDGKDWGTGRKLSDAERAERGVFGALDAIPILGQAAKGFKGIGSAPSMAKLSKMQDAGKVFNPNTGKNVVQSLRDNSTLKNALNTVKKTQIPVGVKWADTGMGVKLPYVEYSTAGDVAKSFGAGKDEAYQLAKGHSGSGGSTGASEAVEQNYVLFNKTHAGSAPVPKGTGPNGGRLQSHHGVQKQWAIDNLAKYGYDPNLAPTITIETGKGMPHTSISTAQNARRNARVAEGNGKWSSSLQDELQYIVDDLKNAGFSNDTINSVLEQQYKMLDKLKVPYERVVIK